MSATGRATELALPGLNDIVGRHPDDFYRTPGWAVDLILPHLVREQGPPTWIDAGCGDGVIAQRVLARWPASRGFGVEIDPGRAQFARGVCPVYASDFLAVDPIWFDPVDLVIGNPPYSLALEFLRRALQLGKEVAFLLRAGFLEARRGSDRDLFLEEHPSDVYLLARRPRFTGDGGGDSATYCWCVWGPGRGTRFCRLRAPEVP